ncbi:trace amine-associated receptor 1-like [Megalops cyprinoides]|uniref:trace amine-associated receptor 1-like n=1 Tax=Megalops cyprinoides TaxID=118141 RepID=UPI001864FB96|nr:trace amine-associated receptor 1-like [Megalops cyprinoides]
MSISNDTDYNNIVFTGTHYCYESLRGSCERLSRPLSIQFLMFLFMGFTILVTVSGNLLVITSIAHFKQLHTSTNYLILSLAVCDFLLGVFVMPCSAVRSVLGCWYLGDFMCKIHTSTDIMLSTSSIFHLSFISIDRYFAVCNPLMYRSIINSVTILIMLTTSWVIPAIFAYGMIFSELNVRGSEEFFEVHVKCIGGCPVFFSRASAVVASTFSFFIPGLIILTIYLKIYLVARGQARSIKDLAQQFRMGGENESRASRQRERRGASTLAIVVGVFLTCWTPFFLCNIIDPFIGYSIPPVLVDALVWFGYLNSAFNPVVYAFFYSWFKKALKIIICGEIFHRGSCRMQLYTE